MVTFLSVFCWLGWTLPLRGWWEGMAFWMKRPRASIPSVIIWIQHRGVHSCKPLPGWEMTCRYLPGTLSVSMYSLDPSATQAIVTFWPSACKVSGFPKMLDSICIVWWPVVSDPWCLQETQRECIRWSLRFHLLGLPNWVGLVWQIGGSYHIKLFWASCLPVIQYFWHGLFTLMCRGNALRMRESVTKCVKVIWGFLIALTDNFKYAAHVSRLSVGKHTWHFLHLRETGAFQNTVIAVSVGQIHIYKRQPGYILCLQQAVESSKLNSATQLSLTECWISERICILEQCMTGSLHTH